MIFAHGCLCWSADAGEGNIERKEPFQTQRENVAEEPLEEPDKSSKVSSEVKKTWGFRRSTVLKREMPVEAAANSPENRCPVRRSGRQSKRTDKLEEFLLTAKRGSRKSAPLTLETGDRTSQTQTDAETASEASFDGNADTKVVEDKLEGPERRTRSGTRKQTQRSTQGGRQSRGAGEVTVKDEGSSDNEENSRDAAKKDELHDNDEERKNDKSEPNPEHVGNTTTAQPQPELDSEKKGVAEEKDEHEETDEKMEMENETDEDSADKPAAMLLKRGPIRTYINKKRAANRNTSPVKAPAPVKKEIKTKSTQAAGNTCKSQKQDDDDDNEDDDDDDDDDEDDEDENGSSASSSSIESDDGGYDPNALYCICRQKHNKRYCLFVLIVSYYILKCFLKWCKLCYASIR